MEHTKRENWKFPKEGLSVCIGSVSLFLSKIDVGSDRIWAWETVQTVFVQTFLIGFEGSLLSQRMREMLISESVFVAGRFP